MVRYEDLTKVERRLISLLNETDLNDDDLYSKTGFRFDDVETEEDFNEVVRLLSLYYMGLDSFYIDKE